MGGKPMAEPIICRFTTICGFSHLLADFHPQSWPNFLAKNLKFGFKKIWPWRSNRGRFWHMASPTWGPNDRFEPLNASIGFRMIISQHCAKVGRLEKNWIFFRKFFQFFADFSRVDRALGPKFLPQIPEVLGFLFDVKCWGGGAATAQDILGQSWGVFWIFVIFLKKFAI